MNRSLKILYFYNGLFVMAHQALGPIFAIFVEGIESDILAVSVSWGISLASTTLFTLVISRVGDKVKEKELLLIGGYLVRALVWFLYIFVNHIYWLFVLQVVLGFGASLGTPAFGTVFAEHLDEGKHMADYSRWSIVANVSSMVGVLAGGFIVKYFGFDALFAIISFMAFICGLGVLLKPRDLL